MSFPMLFFLSLLRCLLITAHPLYTNQGDIYSGDGAHGASADEPTIGIGNLSTSPIECFGLNRSLHSVPLRSRITKTNSTNRCRSPAFSSFEAGASAFLKDLQFTTIADADSGRLLPAMTKAEAGRLVWTSDDNIGLSPPPLTISRILELPSQSQQTGALTPSAPIDGKPSATLLPTRPDSTSSADVASNLIIAGQTFQIGAPASSFPELYSALALNGAPTNMGDRTRKLILPTPPPNLAPLTFGGSAYTANSASQFMLAGQTLNPGSEIIVSGTPVSLAADGAVAIVGSSSITQVLAQTTPPPHPAAAAAAAAAAAPAILTLAGSSYTADASSDFLIDHQTLHPGGAITAQGSAISLDQGGRLAVINSGGGGGGSTQTLAYASITLAPSRPSFTFNGTEIVQDSASNFIIGGQTLSAGGAPVSAGGTPISFAAGGGDLVIGTSTTSLETAGSPTAAGGTVDSYQSGSGATGRQNAADRWCLGFAAAGTFAVWFL